MVAPIFITDKTQPIRYRIRMGWLFPHIECQYKMKSIYDLSDDPEWFGVSDWVRLTRWEVLALSSMTFKVAKRRSGD